MRQVEMIKSEAVIDVKIGSQFLKDLQASLLYLSSLYSVDVIKETVRKGNEGESLNEWENAFYTLLVLITTAEENARKAGLTTLEDIPEEPTLPEVSQ